MKIMIKVTGPDRIISGVKELPSKDHLAAQIKYPKIVYRDRTIYTRKTKYKNKKENNFDE